jgi:hypothetical protein
VVHGPAAGLTAPQKGGRPACEETLEQAATLRPFFLPLFTNVLEGVFSELPLYGVLGSSQPLATLTEVRMWQFPQRKMGHMTDMRPTSSTLTLGRAAFRYPSYTDIPSNSRAALFRALSPGPMRPAAPGQRRGVSSS